MTDRFQAVVYGTVLAAGIGWVLHVGKDVFVPIVFSVLVVYVIVGFTGLIFRLPLVGRLLPRGLGYALSALVIVLALAATGSLIAARIGGVIALAPQYAASLLNTIADVSARLGVEVTPTWTTESRRSGLASSLSAACAPRFPSSARWRSRDCRSESRATSLPAKNPLAAMSSATRIRRRP